MQTPLGQLRSAKAECGRKRKLVGHLRDVESIKRTRYYIEQIHFYYGIKLKCRQKCTSKATAHKALLKVFLLFDSQWDQNLFLTSRNCSSLSIKEFMCRRELFHCSSSSSDCGERHRPFQKHGLSQSLHFHLCQQSALLGWFSEYLLFIFIHYCILLSALINGALICAKFLPAKLVRC